MDGRGPGDASALAEEDLRGPPACLLTGDVPKAVGGGAGATRCFLLEELESADMTFRRFALGSGANRREPVELYNW